MPPELLRAAEEAKGFMPPNEGLALFEVACDYGARGPVCEIGTYCGKSADLPRRGGPADRVRGRHRRPPPRLGGDPARLGAPRPGAGRPALRPDGLAARLPRHDRRGGPGGRGDRDRRQVRAGGRALAHSARHAVHRRRPLRGAGHPRLRGLGAARHDGRGAGLPRHLPRPGRRRAGALPDLPARAGVRRVRRGARRRARCASWSGWLRGSRRSGGGGPTACGCAPASSGSPRGRAGRGRA